MLTYENYLSITFMTTIMLLVGSKSRTEFFSIAEEKKNSAIRTLANKSL